MTSDSDTRTSSSCMYSKISSAYSLHIVSSCDSVMSSNTFLICSISTWYLDAVPGDTSGQTY